MTRDDHLVALGGGVVGDLAGFCAHLYQRGVPVVQVPTTLVAQVDSAYGGKTGVDLPEGKNYAGAYHLPAAVIADTGDAGDAAAGGAGGRLRRGAEDRPARRRRALGAGAGDRGARPRPSSTTSSSPAPATSARSSPPTSATAAGATCSTSATRSATRSRRRPATARYRHGEAVGLGLLAALRLSDAPRAARRGRGDPAPATACRSGSDPGGRRVDAVLDALQRDKKRTAAGVGFVLLSEPGEPRVGQLVDPARVRAAVEELLPMTTTRNRVAVLHGVNFDILERRDPAFYGGLSLSELEQQIGDWARGLGLEPIFFQTNHEGEFVEYLHRLPDLADAAIVNAGAWTHYSRAIADALDVARPAGGRGPPLRRREPRRLAPGLGLRRPGAGEDLRQGRRRLPRGAGAAGRRARRLAPDARPRRPPRGAAGRARARPDAGHRPDQRPLPDRLHRHQRGLRLRAGPAPLLHRLPLHRARRRRGRGLGADHGRAATGWARSPSGSRAGSASRTTRCRCACWRN